MFVEMVKETECIPLSAQVVYFTMMMLKAGNYHYIFNYYKDLG